MKRLVIDDGKHAMEQLIGERVTFFCMNYIYTGKLSGINETCVLLTEAAVVYETGGFMDAKWRDAQSLPHDWYVQLSAIESFGVIR